jgi:hypothetical protein
LLRRNGWNRFGVLLAWVSLRHLIAFDASEKKGPHARAFDGFAFAAYPQHIASLR